jgi:hypothetical protein
VVCALKEEPSGAWLVALSGGVTAKSRTSGGVHGVTGRGVSDKVVVAEETKEDSDDFCADRRGRLGGSEEADWDITFNNSAVFLAHSNHLSFSPEKFAPGRFSLIVVSRVLSV